MKSLINTETQEVIEFLDMNTSQKILGQKKK